MISSGDGRTSVRLGGVSGVGEGVRERELDGVDELERVSEQVRGKSRECCCRLRTARGSLSELVSPSNHGCSVLRGVGLELTVMSSHEFQSR